MKKLFVSLLLVMSILFLQFCSSSKKTSRSSAEKMNGMKTTYTANVQPLIAVNCSPCHIPPKGNKKALDTYAAASANIDDMIARIQKNPADKGFMPFKHAKLPDSTINVFVQWKKDGLLEK